MFLFSDLFWGVHSFQERRAGEHTELCLAKPRSPTALSPVLSPQCPATAGHSCGPSSVPVCRIDMNWHFEEWAAQISWWERWRRVEIPPFSGPCVKLEFIARCYSVQIQHQAWSLLKQGRWWWWQCPPCNDSLLWGQLACIMACSRSIRCISLPQTGSWVSTGLLSPQWKPLTHRDASVLPFPLNWSCSLPPRFANHTLEKTSIARQSNLDINCGLKCCVPLLLLSVDLLNLTALECTHTQTHRYLRISGATWALMLSFMSWLNLTCLKFWKCSSNLTFSGP